MNLNLFRLDEDRVLIEQLRLVLGNVASALVPTILLSIVLIYALNDSNNTANLAIWGTVLIAAKITARVHAKRTLASNITSEQVLNHVWILIILNGIDGAIWSALGWITLDESSVTASILVISTITGMVGSSVSRLSAIFPVFLSFLISLLSLTAIKFLQMNDPAYSALGVIAFIFMTSVTLMARNSAQEITKAINLRFENAALLDQLKLKSEAAETAQHKAEEANSAKSKFLASASHDLRQPIHALGLFLEVLANTGLNNRQMILLNNARSATHATGDLLNSLLDISRIEAGVIQPNIQPVPLEPLLTKIISEYQAQAHDKNLVLRSHLNSITVMSDPILLERIVRNLVSNALRYTLRNGVLVSCRKRNNQAVIEVWDTGIGIAPEYHEDIFREFHQLGNPERDRRKGLGLGLAIAQGLSHKLNHQLTLRSISGRGSVFRIAIELCKNAPETVISPDAYSQTLLSGLRVLLVDDDEAIRVGTLQLLSNWGCECDAAETIDEALVLARENPPDIVICDYRLREEHTGLEAISKLRQLLDENLPAILITGDTAADQLREVKTSGIELLHKPVSPEQLFAALADASILPAAEQA